MNDAQVELGVQNNVSADYTEKADVVNSGDVVALSTVDIAMPILC